MVVQRGSLTEMIERWKFMSTKMKTVRFIMANEVKNKTRISDACHGHLLLPEEENAFNVYYDKKGS